MAEGTVADIKASINNELRAHYQRHVDAYRPDLKGDSPPGEPIFHPLNPCHLKEELEIDRKEFSVADLLTIQLKEDVKLPRKVLLLGRPESGKTALFALILHYWLHGKQMMKGLKDFDFLLAVQCLGLESLPSDRTTAVDLEKHMLDHLPETLKKHGEEGVRQTMREAKVLIMIDSLDYLENSILDESTSLAPWTDSRVILFSRYKFMKDNPSHPFHYDQDQDKLVLKLMGGMAINPFGSSGKTPNISELGGVFSGKQLKKYCQRLCKCRGKEFKTFWKYYTEILKYFSLDMRKPFNIYLAMEAFCDQTDFNAQTPSELCGKWIDVWSKIYTTAQKSDSNMKEIIIKGIHSLAGLAYKAFNSETEYISHEDSHANPELVPILTHFLMPHYNPHGNIEKFTFRISDHMLFLAAKQSVIEIDSGMTDVTDILLEENFKTLEPLTPMVLGLAKGSHYYEKIKEQTLVLAKHNMDDHCTKSFHDPIINYAVAVLSETKLFAKTNKEFDPFVRSLVDSLRPKNWSIVDGNIHPHALRALCECRNDKNKGQKEPQRLNIVLSGSPTDMPGLHDILKAVTDCDMRISFSNDHSFLNDEGEFPLDDALSALHGKGGVALTDKRRASLASFSGYLQHINMLDSHPATRRIYKISLRICSTINYENLRDLCKVSHKLKQVILRISHKADINVKRLKELPTSIAKLTVFLEGFTDENVEKAITIWKSIQGQTQREVRELRFWVINDKNMTPSGVKEVICNDLPGTKIELSLDQPVSEMDEKELQEALNKQKEDNYVIRLLGSSQYPRRDLKRETKA